MWSRTESGKGGRPTLRRRLKDNSAEKQGKIKTGNQTWLGPEKRARVGAPAKFCKSREKWKIQHWGKNERPKERSTQERIQRWAKIENGGEAKKLSETLLKKMRNQNNAV